MPKLGVGPSHRHQSARIVLNLGLRFKASDLLIVGWSIDSMGCSSSKENDKTAVGGRSIGQTYNDQAEDAAAMLTTGMYAHRLPIGATVE